MILLKDHYGTPIIAGANVAFNYQGQVRKGKVLEVKNATKYGRTHNYNNEQYHSIKISHADNPTLISKVTSRFNVSVI